MRRRPGGSSAFGGVALRVDSASRKPSQRARAAPHRRPRRPLSPRSFRGSSRGQIRCVLKRLVLFKGSFKGSESLNAATHDSLQGVRVVERRNASFNNSDPLKTVVTDADEETPRLSPDGRWVAYASNETGQFQVYARAADGIGGRVSLSAGYGAEPVWTPDGRGLYFRGEGALAKRPS